MVAPAQVIALCTTWHFNDRSIVMEDLGLRVLYRRVAGIDVHRMLHVVESIGTYWKSVHAHLESPR